MRKRNRVIIAVSMLLLLLLLPGVAYSGDQAYFHLTGFSFSGEFVGWETGGIQDGSGFKWANLEVLNTTTSRIEESLDCVWDEYMDELPSDDIIQDFQEDKENFYDSWGITTFESSILQPLVFYPLTDLGANRETVTFCLDRYVPDYHSGEITLTLINKPAGIEQAYPDWFPPPVTPVLHVKTSINDQSVFFQEREVPEQWKLSMSYGIYAVYRNPILLNNIVVVLTTTEPGFEGPNGRFRVISGSL